MKYAGVKIKNSMLARCRYFASFVRHSTLLSDRIKSSLTALGVEQLSSIQDSSLAAFEGAKSPQLLLHSPTGTGKTLAFLLPIFRRLDPNLKRQVLILVPTMDLAKQIFGVCNQIEQGSASVFGQVAFDRTAGGLASGKDLDFSFRSPIVVGTVGKVGSQEGKKLASVFSSVHTLVLDEVDAIVDDRSSAKELCKIGDALRKNKVSIIGSCATLPLRPRNFPPLARCRLVREGEPPGSCIGSYSESQRRVISPLPVPQARHEFIELAGEQPFVGFFRDHLLSGNMGERALVFFNSSDLLDSVIDELIEVLGLDSVSGRLYSLSGCTDIEGRLGTISRFCANFPQKGSVEILFCTDGMARGIDFLGVDAVVNFGPPPSSTAYLHRSGRTARMGRPGVVITTYSGQSQLQAILKIKEMVR